MKLAVIGSNMIDVISYTDIMPVAGETREVKDFAINCGGKGANQAIAAAKLGADVLMITTIGDDIFGKMVLDNFNAYHVDTKYVQTAKGSSNGIATILVDESSQNRILINKGANTYLTAVDVEAAALDLQQCALCILQLEINLNTVYAAIEFANKHQIPLLLNPAPAIAELDLDMACKCDFFVPNETELNILTGLPVESEAEIKKAALTLVDRGLKNVIVTMGSRGSLWVNKEHCEHVPAYNVHAVDTTGAGDAFIGCFAAVYVKTKDILQAIQQATLFAALSVTKTGTQASYPTEQEFTRALDRLRFGSIF